MTWHYVPSTCAPVTEGSSSPCDSPASDATLEAAQVVGRHAIGIDLDERNAELARDRVGMFLEVVA